MAMRGDKQVNSVKITGLKEFQEAVRKLGYEAAKDIAEAVGAEASSLVVTRVKPKIPLGPGLGGHARNSVKAVKKGILYEVQAGGPNFPYYPWLDFGGRVGKKQSVRRRFIKEGRYVWSTMNDLQPEIQEIMVKYLTDTLREAGLV